MSTDYDNVVTVSEAGMTRTWGMPDQSRARRKVHSGPPQEAKRTNWEPRGSWQQESRGEDCFELLPHPPYSPDLAPSDYYLFADLKKILQGKRFYSNEEVITETNAYFEAKDKSFYKNGIEMLEKRWTVVLLLKETMLMNKVEFCQKCVFPS